MVYPQEVKPVHKLAPVSLISVQVYRFELVEQFLVRHVSFVPTRSYSQKLPGISFLFLFASLSYLFIFRNKIVKDRSKEGLKKFGEALKLFLSFSKERD